MEELDEVPSSSSKSIQLDGVLTLSEDIDGLVNIKLPDQLKKIAPAEEFVSVRHRWNTNEEIASILIAFKRHKEWLVLPQKIRPASGSMLLYNRKVVFYRRDGYCWKKRRNGSTIREDHMKLKVQGLECIYGSYVHSAILPTFHRRCYWLLQNPNIVLLHYLNVPYPEAAKPSLPSLSHELRRKDWTKEELVDQLRPMLSRVIHGNEHDAEEDQKVENMLEELLPVLIPMQEGSKAVQPPLVASKLIALDANSMLSSPIIHPSLPSFSSSSSPSVTSSSCCSKRPIAPSFQGTPMRAIHPQSLVLQSHQQEGQQQGQQHQQIQHHQQQQQQEKLKALCQGLAQTPSELQPMLPSSQLIHTSPSIITHQQATLFQKQPQQLQQQQHHHVHQVQTIHPLTSGALAHDQLRSTILSSTANSKNKKNFYKDIPLAQTVSGDCHLNGYLIQDSPAFLPMPNLQTSTGVLASCSEVEINHSSQDITMSTSGELPDMKCSSSVFSIPPSSVIPAVAATCTSHDPLSSPCLPPSHAQTSPGTNLLTLTSLPLTTVADSQPSGMVITSTLPSSGLTFNNIQDSQQVLHSSQQLMHLQQQQHQQRQQQQQQPPPMLTLHLQPSNGSSTDGQGFVLSLQGATIVTPQSTSQAFEPARNSSFKSGNSADSQSLNNNNLGGGGGGGFVLVASQNSVGGLVLNQISANSQAEPVLLDASFPELDRNLPAPGAPSGQQDSQYALGLPTFSDGNVAVPTSPLGAQTGKAPSTYMPFSHSSLTASSITHEPQHHHHHHHHHHHNHNHQQAQQQQSFLGIFSSADDKKNTTNSYVFAGGSESSFAGKKSDSLDSMPTISLSFDQGSFSKNSKTEAAAAFTKDVFSSPVIVAQQQQQQEQSSHTPAPHDLMAGPSGIHPTMITTPPSACDTLDGSFSSLPSADLNLDDFLDLNDLDDVSDIAVSPLSPPELGDPPLSTSDIALAVTGSAGSMPGLQASETLAPFSRLDTGQLEVPPTSSQQQQQQPAPLVSGLHSRPPSSPLHPGAPPRPQCSYSPMYVGSQQEDQEGSCHLGADRETSDPEINSVIKDFSPDWAYTKSSTKVLVAGPWCRGTAHYSCVFDGVHIPATLLQPGLLRCHTQHHAAGYAMLQVARDDVVISNCEVFKFCDKDEVDTVLEPEWFAIGTDQLKLLLMERMDQLHRQFASYQTPFEDCISDPLESSESSLVCQVQDMSRQTWLNSQQYPKAGQHNLTLLHLAAGLGFAKLISCLIRWRSANTSVALEFEVDAQSVDSHACTPLMWACALGNIDAALTLYHWSTSPLKMCNKDGLLPLTLARRKGYYNLANQVEQLERAQEQQQKTKHQQLQIQALYAKQAAMMVTSRRMDITNSSRTSGNLLSSTSTVTSSSSSSSTSSSSTSVTDKEGSELDYEVKDKQDIKEGLQIQIPPPLAFPKPGKPGPKLIRRFSEQVISQSTKPLNKRNSVDLLPSGQDVDHATLPAVDSGRGHSVRQSTSEPQLPVSPDMAFVAPPAPRLLLEDEIDEPSTYSGEASTSKMDTDEAVVTIHDGSPIIDVERISSDEELDANKDGTKHQMVTLANQIIAAIPERIKLSPSKGDEMDDASSGRGRSESHSSLPSQGSPHPSSFGDDSGISTPMTDSLAFEEYRYPEFGTPASSLSPDSTCLPSPYSPYSFTLDSPPPTTAEFTEYFNAPTTYMEKDFSQLTLSDQEQRKLYEAAKVIQNAYRHYRDKQQQKEIEAAILIQSYYRRYKTYAYYKKMSHAAVLIQNQFRTYYAKRKKRGDIGPNLQGLRRESERLKKGRNQSVIIQQRFRSHYQRKSLDGKEGSSQAQGQGSCEAPDSSPTPADTSSQGSDRATPVVDADVEATKPVVTGDERELVEHRDNPSLTTSAMANAESMADNDDDDAGPGENNDDGPQVG